MKILSVAIVIGLLLALYLTVGGGIVINDGKLHPLSVTVNKVNPEYKTVVVFVYDEEEQRTHKKIVSASEAKNPIVFEAVETGRYGVFVHQNRDDDLEFKISSKGMPLESLGYSNNPMLMEEPSFSDVSIKVTEPTQISVDLITIY